MIAPSRKFSIIAAVALAVFSLAANAAKPQQLVTHTLLGGPFFIDAPTPYSWLNCSIVAAADVVPVTIEICYTDLTQDPLHPICDLMDQSVIQQTGDIASVEKAIGDIPYYEGSFQLPSMYCKVTFDARDRSAIRGTACLTEGGTGPGVCVPLQ